MATVFRIDDVLGPLLRHLISTPTTNVSPQRIRAFVEAIDNEGNSPATIRRLTEEHFGPVGGDIDAIVARVIRHAHGNGSIADAAFLTLDDIAKPGGDGFIIPAVDRAYRRWVTAQKKLDPPPAYPLTPEQWVTNHIEQRGRTQYRRILDALLGPASLRQRGSRKGAGLNGWRVFARAELKPHAGSLAATVRRFNDPAEFDEAARRIARERNITEPPPYEEMVETLREYLQFFASKRNAARVSHYAQQAHLPVNEQVHLLPTTHNDFDEVTVSYITGGRLLHEDEFLHRLFDGYEAFNAVARANDDLGSILDLSGVTDDVAEIMRLAFSGKGGKNSHGFVYEVVVTVERTIGEGSAEADLHWKVLQMAFRNGDGPDMGEVFRRAGPDGWVYSVRYVQVKSVSRASDIKGPRGELLRQNGSDIVRTWADMPDDFKEGGGGPLKAYVKPDQGPAVPHQWVDVEAERVMVVDEDRLVMDFHVDGTPEGAAQLAAEKARRKAQIADYAQDYNEKLTQDSRGASQVEFDDFLDAHDRSYGKGAPRARETLTALRDAELAQNGHEMTMQEVALARLLIDTNTGILDPDLWAWMRHPDTPIPFLKVEFASPKGMPHMVRSDTRLPEPADVPDLPEVE